MAKSPHAPPPAAAPPPPGGKPTCVLALQGGGALGAYHIGAYQALAEHGYEPDWFSGISIGAINSAILAGNRPENRLARLEELWQMISWPEVLQPLRLLPLEVLHNNLSNAEALLMGQPHFFRPRPVSPLFAPAGSPTQASFYDTSPMLETLARLVDFEFINKGPVRLTLGATDVETGDVVFFDSADKANPITPAHVLASGSLPPGFPATEVGGRFYWDGGCVSNTPAEAVVEHQPPGHTLIFMIDLWGASGPAPTTMNEVFWRAKQIQYASRGRFQAERLAMRANLHHAARLAEAKAARKGGGEADSAVPASAHLEEGRRIDVMHIIYHPGPGQIPNSDAEFSRSSIQARREAGYKDMSELLAQRPWHQAETPPYLGAVLHHVARGQVMSRTTVGMEPATVSLSATAAPAAQAKPAA